MSDEDALSRAASKAARAHALIGNELLTEAFKSLKEQYSTALLATTVDQAEARERLYLAHRVVGEVERHLVNVISDGKLAAAELKALAETGERKKRFGIV